jgi:hypothetical protein
MSNKANARDWHVMQRQVCDDIHSLEQQKELLRYAADKRKMNYPSVSELTRLGHGDVASIVESAYRLLGDAELLLRDR